MVATTSQNDLPKDALPHSSSVGSSGGKMRPPLSGRAFYESLGSPKIVLAPMVDQSEFAWRMLTRSYLPKDAPGCLLAYTPMIHARLFAESHKYRHQSLQPTKTSVRSQVEKLGEKEETGETELYLDGNPRYDRPLFVQFCANSPDELLGAAKYVEPYCDAVDLNLGCPQGIAKKGNYGAFLQENWDLIYNLINTLHENLCVPVTAKMRILETKEKTLEYARMILSAGASLLTVHGRQREQKGHKTGLADWTVIRFLREQLPRDTVIFANGNVLCHDDIQKCLEITGADGIMSAEGNLYDPAIFAPPPPVGQEGREYWRGHDGRGGYRMDAVFRRYMDIIYQYILEQDPPPRQPLFLPSDLTSDTSSSHTGSDPLEASFDSEPPSKRLKKDNKSSLQPRITSPSITAMQAHLFHLLRPLVTKHTHIRDALARARSGDVALFEHILHLVEEATRSGLLDFAADPDKYTQQYSGQLTEEEEAQVVGKPEGESTSLRTRVRVRRPWWVCQPYVRPLPAEALEKGSLQMGKKEMAKQKAESEKRKVNHGEEGGQAQLKDLNKTEENLNEKQSEAQHSVKGIENMQQTSEHHSPGTSHVANNDAIDITANGQAGKEVVREESIYG